MSDRVPGAAAVSEAEPSGADRFFLEVCTLIIEGTLSLAIEKFNADLGRPRHGARGLELTDQGRAIVARVKGD